MTGPVAGDRSPATILIPSVHPSLDGHFPGRPVVPGVVILDYVIDAAERFVPASFVVRGLVQVKFVRVLLPDEEASIELESRDSMLHFSVKVGTDLVARGTLRLELVAGS